MWQQIGGGVRGSHLDEASWSGAAYINAEYQTDIARQVGAYFAKSAV